MFRLNLHRKTATRLVVIMVALLFGRLVVQREGSHNIFSISHYESRGLVNTFTHQAAITFDDVVIADANPSSDVNTDNNESIDEEEDEDEDWELDSFQMPWGVPENYKLLKKLGEGVYSDVFECIDVLHHQSCVSKQLKLVSKRSVKREVKILQELSDGPNIIKLVDVLKDETNAPSILTEYVNNTYHRKLYPSFRDKDVRFYLFQLLRAIDYAHARKIMHRDIKPHNVMIDHQNRKLRLIDWGLSDYYDGNYSYPTMVASRFWKAPELLVGYGWYNLSTDMWSFGCMLAALVFGQEPFFRGRHVDENQLVEITKILGTDDLFAWLRKYDIKLGSEFDDLLGWYQKRSWESLAVRDDEQFIPDDALDLIKKILVYDHHDRITAAEALTHTYFDPVRVEASSDTNTVTLWKRS